MKLKIPIIVFATFLLVQSCSTIKKEYSREILKEVNVDMYRTEREVNDTTNLAQVKWQELFTDKQLQNHITTALNQNLDLMVALENIENANAYVLQAKAGQLPTLSVGPSVTYSSSSVNTQFGQIIGDRQYITQYEFGANLSWEADIWGKIASQKRAQLATYLQSVAAHQAIKSEIVSAIATYYYQLLSFDAQKEILNETILSRKSSLETSKALKEAGQLTEAAVKQYEAQVLNAEAQIISIDNNIKIVENAMSVLMGNAPQSIARGRLDAQEIQTELVKSGVPVQLLDNRPDVLAAEYSLVNSLELSNVARASMYPTLSLSANGGLQSVDIDKLFNANSLFFNLIGSLTQPIFNQRQLKTQKEVALNNQQIAYLNYKSTILNAGQEVSNALSDYETQTKLADLKEQEYQAYFDSRNYSDELLNYGLADYLDVLVAEQNALNAKLNAISADYGKLNAVVQLYLALGGGWR